MRGGVKNDCTKDVKNDCTKDVYYKNHRFPAEIISHAVWLYFRFCLSFRDVEELLFERGVIVTSEVIRKWCRKFGQQYANQLCRRRPRPGDKWHLDEVFLTIKGERHYLWRAVDQDGNVLDILVQRRRDKQAALPIINPIEMGQPSLEAAVARIAAIGEYQQTFRAVFGGPPNGLDLLHALAAYERTQLSFDAPFDRFIAGDQNAVDDAARGVRQHFR